MDKFTTHQGKVAILDRANVDTDQIMPKQFLKSIARTGFGQYCFDEWRYLDKGEPGMDCTNRPLNLDFSLNQPQFQGASVLLTRDNFGCGSSREHAVWGLKEYGFMVIIAPSFAEIFFNNCVNNGVLAISCNNDEIDKLIAHVNQNQDAEIIVDLNAQTFKFTNTDLEYKFAISSAAKNKLLNGLDDIGLTLQLSATIKGYEEQRLEREPWVFM